MAVATVSILGATQLGRCDQLGGGGRATDLIRTRSQRAGSTSASADLTASCTSPLVSIVTASGHATNASIIAARHFGRGVGGVVCAGPTVHALVGHCGGGLAAELYEVRARVVGQAPSRICARRGQSTKRRERRTRPGRGRRRCAAAWSRRSASSWLRRRCPRRRQRGRAGSMGARRAPCGCRRSAARPQGTARRCPRQSVDLPVPGSPPTRTSRTRPASRWARAKSSSRTSVLSGGLVALAGADGGHLGPDLGPVGDVVVGQRRGPGVGGVLGVGGEERAWARSGRPRSSRSMARKATSAKRVAETEVVVELDAVEDPRTVVEAEDVVGQRSPWPSQARRRRSVPRTAARGRRGSGRPSRAPGRP